GTKVERVERFGVGDPQAFVVGRVLAADPHPDADRLSVCRVDVGDGEAAQIVCGAPNVAAGQTVAVARPGAVMPDGTKLGTAELRGVESQGMILAEDELAIGTEHAGILVLDENGYSPGTPLADVLPIVDDVLELEITPNRPDCLGVYGVAREVHAATGAALAAPPWLEDPGAAGEIPGVEVRVEVPELCPRFTARLFEDVTIAPSPPWLKARLMAAGQRPISNVVDITNYVMLLTAQPLHAFDFDRVAGGRLVVRRAGEGEEVETLDGERRRLDPDVVVIEDAEGPTSIAGIMGGARSEVAEGTTRVLMEAATWNGPNIHRSSLRLGLRSEASGRFEKQLQPEFATQAQAVAARLMVELCGATLVPGTVDIGGPGPPPAAIHLRERRVTALLGAPIARERQREILESLEFGVADADDGLDATVPPHRRDDVTREADLIEEVARMDGVDRLPATLPARQDAGGGLTSEQRANRRVEDALTGHGMLEIMGWSFQSPAMADRLRLPADDPRRRFVRLRNPLSEDQSVMRTLLLGSLLEVAAYNAARDVVDLRLFETGGVYLADVEGALPDERRHVGVLLSGAARPRSWRTPQPPPSDFFAAKGVLTALLDTLRLQWNVAEAPQPFLHPGRSAAVEVEGEALGWLGEVHPLVARAWDLDGAAAFELDLDRLAELAGSRVEIYEDVTSFPAVRQDIAVVVADDVPAERVRQIVHEAGGDLLRRAEVFDVYRGDQVGEGRVSLALALEFGAPDRTLTDDEVSERRAAIADALKREAGGELRA
ncbi:MAG TPA: phenylalanine--tRNA ligase subunit beta, partial [Solirubrobacteraceae bacterium]|nr:phenylalanine--tRNA ligase subunit beta [Solirubrobacteraceae bacterium]